MFLISFNIYGQHDTLKIIDIYELPIGGEAIFNKGKISFEIKFRDIVNNKKKSKIIEYKYMDSLEIGFVDKKINNDTLIFKLRSFSEYSYSKWIISYFNKTIFIREKEDSDSISYDSECSCWLWELTLKLKFRTKDEFKVNINGYNIVNYKIPLRKYLKLEEIIEPEVFEKYLDTDIEE